MPARRRGFKGRGWEMKEWEDKFHQYSTVTVVRVRGKEIVSMVIRLPKTLIILGIIFVMNHHSKEVNNRL